MTRRIYSERDIDDIKRQGLPEINPDEDHVVPAHLLAAYLSEYRARFKEVYLTSIRSIRNCYTFYLRTTSPWS